MEAKQSIRSNMHINPEDHQGSGVITSFRSSLLGPNQQVSTSHSTLGRSLFSFPVPLSMCQSDPFWSLRPPGAPEIWAQGDSNKPHLQCAMGHKNPNRPKWPKFSKLQKLP
ncbi:hypothetical protein O181_009523 [Austropuccinia psidii MF-1]|uniref:Uncharacterized protein n=1 Tax=Austropuccinia psidii MF-1 TaxID=1389203 RepID=A0A9Q3GJI6_9BASI|nr:hypothetical protein [Austropuccinia psidii MF-1]